jgi:hypothetical protein
MNMAQYNILDYGFKNFNKDGKTAGFQVLVKDSYYRGIYVPLIEGFDVTVDGEKFARNQIQCKFRDNVYGQDDLQNHPNERWQFNEPCTLIITKAGGLKPGFHNVEIVVRERISYMPTIPSVRTFKAKLALVM